MSVALNKAGEGSNAEVMLSKVPMLKSSLILKERGDRVLSFITQFADADSQRTEVLKTNDIFNIHALKENTYQSIINLNKINDIKGIDVFFRTVNSKLPFNGLFIGCVETQQERRRRLFRKFPIYIAPIYFFFDFILKRVFPKLPLTRRIYFLITAGRNRVLSKAETLGRLVFCGFKIIEETEINNMLYFVVSKSKSHYDCTQKRPPLGFLFKMERVGQYEKPLYVYKIRTMHPYAEYLQEYIYSKNQLKEGGKIKNDYRITNWGKVMRRLWLDELPMIYNLFKGQLKLVGVRPISKHYLSLYSEELKQKRFNIKPGLIPPFYADMPASIEEIVSSELRYIEAYEKKPFRTDITYFFRATKNILFKNARSN